MQAQTWRSAGMAQCISPRGSHDHDGGLQRNIFKAHVLDDPYSNH
jgi:hypothetical protein